MISLLMVHIYILFQMHTKKNIPYLTINNKMEQQVYFYDLSQIKVTVYNLPS